MKKINEETGCYITLAIFMNSENPSNLLLQRLKENIDV